MAGIRIAGIWEKQGQNGEVYYEGTWGNTIIRVYSNKYKTTEKHPDCVIYLSEKKDMGARAPKQNQSAPPRQPSTAPFQRSRPPETFGQPNTPAPTTKYAGTVPPNENQAPWPDVDGDNPDDIPF